MSARYRSVEVGLGRCGQIFECRRCEIWRHDRGLSYRGPTMTPVSHCAITGS